MYDLFVWMGYQQAELAVGSVKPCPVCGSKPRVSSLPNSVSKYTGPYYFVTCDTCNVGSMDKDAETAAHIWNERYPKIFKKAFRGSRESSF